MKIFGICGSLKKDSANALLLAEAYRILKNHTWNSTDLSLLPYFQPEIQFTDETPSLVKDLRHQLAQSDLILIMTPEYAHGMPGVLKNALEWFFCEGTMKKRVALVIGSSQGEHTRDQLIEVLTTMDFLIDEEDTLLVQGARSKFDEKGHLKDESVRKELESFLLRVTSKVS